MIPPTRNMSALRKTMHDDISVWAQKGATLSQNSAIKEFGLTYEELTKAANSKQIRWQVRSAHGNPYYLLVRSEVKDLAEKLHGKSHVNSKLQSNALKKAKAELAKVMKLAHEIEKVIEQMEEGKWDGSQPIPSMHPPEECRRRGWALKTTR